MQAGTLTAIDGLAGNKVGKKEKKHIEACSNCKNSSWEMCGVGNHPTIRAHLTNVI